MLDHLIDPDIPTKRQELEYDFEMKKEEVDRLHHQYAEVKDKLGIAIDELSELRHKLNQLERDT